MKKTQISRDPFARTTTLGLAIDHDDSHAYQGNESFALLLHGTQAKGSVAAKAA